MGEKKKVDPLVIRIALEYGIEKARKEAPDYFDKFPPSILPGAVEVDRCGFQPAYDPEERKEHQGKEGRGEEGNGIADPPDRHQEGHGRQPAGG